jgi:DNA repair protein RadD
MNLFDYQQAVVNDYHAKLVAGFRRPLIVAPTASGKTVMAGAIVADAVKSSQRVLFLAHRDELLTQARRSLARWEIVAGIIKAGRDNDQRPQALVQIASIQTLHARAVRRQTMELPPAEIVIVDECHHARAETYQQIIGAYPEAIIIGLTATPCRTDGRGLGNIFECMIEAPQTAELIKLERLVPPRIFTVADPDLKGVQTAKTGDYVISQLSYRINTDVLVGDVVSHWLKHAQQRRTVVFAVDVAHSVNLMREFVQAGVKAEHLDGQTPQDEREQILARLASGETQVVCNCMVLTEGFDLPDLGCIVLVRPTKSLLLFLQMVGRGLRTAPAKKDCIILDHGGCIRRHGRPDDQFVWTLDKDQRAANKTHAKRKSERRDPFTDCNQCGGTRQRGFACDACGYKPGPKGEGVDFVDEDLVELTDEARTYQQAILEEQVFYRELLGYAQGRVTKEGKPYSPAWAAYKFKDKHGRMPPWSWKGFPPLEPTDATLRWIRSRFIAYAKGRAA